MITKNIAVDLKLTKPFALYKTEEKKQPVNASPSENEPTHDELVISTTAKALQLEELREKRLEDQRNDFDEAMDILASIPDSSEESPVDTLSKCLKIALRIMSGDKVPDKDHAFLSEHEPVLYQNAIMLSQKNDDPKEYRSLLDEDKTKENETSISNSSLPDIFDRTSSEPLSSDAIIELLTTEQ